MKTLALVRVALTVGLFGVAASATAQAPVVRARGALPVDPATYASFQGVQRHRAWLNPVVDLSHLFPPVGDQEWQSSCTAWAVGYAARSFLRGNELGRAPTSKAELVSPAYLFHRLRRDKTNCNEPVSVSEALNLLKNEGAASLEDLPYGICDRGPTSQQISTASRWRIGGWRSVQRETPDDWRTPVIIDDIKGQLQAGRPVVFSMAAPRSFDTWAGPGVFESDEAPGSGHAMVLVGYDESKQAFRLINSWGTTWGDKGYAWVGYKTFKRLAGEAYILEPPTAAAPVASVPTPAPVRPPVDAQLATIAQGLECGQVRVRREGGVRVMEGFTGSNGLQAARAAALAADPDLRWNVTYRPWPQCEAELTLARPLAETGARLTVRSADGRALPAEAASLRADALFSVEVTSTPARPYVHVLYLQADGSAVELYRGRLTAASNGELKVVLGAAGTRAARFQVAPPFGDEVLIAIASSEPVFGEELSGYKTERQFLTSIRARLAEASRTGRSVSAAIQRLRTAA